MKEKITFENLGDKEPPYGYLKKHIDLLLGRGVDGLTTCFSCSGSGYDSPKKDCPCCCCYGMGEIFTKRGGAVDSRTQSDLVRELRDEVIAFAKKKEN